jgi:hypothetical protein
MQLWRRGNHYAARAETQLRNIGEHEIQKRLAYFSLPAKIQDIGIDFYCELLEKKECTRCPLYKGV